MTDTKDVTLSGDDGPDRLTRMESEIDQTRSAITDNLGALGERLSPEHLKQEAREVMTEAKNAAVETLHEAKNVATETFTELKDGALETAHEKFDEIRENVRHVERETLGFVRENAVPLALVGVGVAWFLSNQRGRDRDWEGSYRPRGRGRWRYPESVGAHPVGDARSGLTRASAAGSEYAQRTTERARAWAGDAEQRVGDVAGRVRGLAQHEAEQARDLARDTRDRALGATRRAGELAQRELVHARELSRQTTEAHPLAVGAAAVAAGFCIGLLIPETQRESELFGPRREKLVNGAKQAVRETKAALEDVQHTVKTTAKQTVRDVEGTLGGAKG